MRKIIHFLLLLAVGIAIICVVLLLNVTAPNPTGRRYSSAMPLMRGQAGAQAVGADGERILGIDLRLPNNNVSDQRACICGKASDSNNRSCNACLAVVTSISNFRIPDFVSDTFIAESKNEQNFLYTGREVSQINDYVIAALLMKRPLWVFVRVDTQVAPEFSRLVESTGGKVVPYFTVPQYVDPVDSVAKRGLLVSGIATLGIGWLYWRFLTVRRVPRLVTVPAPAPASPKPVSRNMDAAEDYMARTKERAQSRLDREDIWGDEP